MRRAGRVVAEMHEACMLAAKPGATTGDLDAAAREVLDRRGRALQLPELPRLSCGRLHLAQRSDRARHPGRPRDRRRRHRVDRLRRHRGGLARRRRDHDPRGRDRRRNRAGCSTRPRPRSTPASPRPPPVTVWATSVPRSREWRAAAGFSVVKEYVGHGIGTAMHEDPEVPNYGSAGRGLRLREGMVLAIEPMVNCGKATTAPPRRRLDRGDRRRQSIRAFRAHDRDHRRRPAGAHASLGRVFLRRVKTASMRLRVLW